MFVIGLDGATWDVINPNIDQLPTIKDLISKHDHYTVHLAQKPWSASVWCSMFSGKTPEEHQHFDFVKDDKVLTRQDVNVQFIWDILNSQGKNVKALNVPFIVPPYSFNLQFAGPGGGVPITEQELNNEISMITDKVREVYSQEKPDLFIAVYTALDKMSHLHWGEPALVDFYKKIDQVLAEIVEHDDQVLILSDHGFCGFADAPVKTLPEVTSDGTKLKGDHHPDAIVIAKNIPFKINQPMDVFHGLNNYFNK